MILDRIVAATRIRVEEEKERRSLDVVRKEAMRIAQDELAHAKGGTYSFPFEEALRAQDINFICEVKQASPSKGRIVTEFPYCKIAKDYERAGAAAISVLTEPYFFKGSATYLQDIANIVHIPLLRKDFIIDAYQIYEAKLIGASAILLIASILDLPTLRAFRELADSLGLSCLVEAHDEAELERAMLCGARVIGVNNRNLKDFTVNIENSLSLRHLVPDDCIFVSESGLTSPEDIEQLRAHHIHAALMGEACMRSTDKVAFLAHLYGRPSFSRVKFCGISEVETIPHVVACGPDYMGLVFAPSSRHVSMEEAVKLVQALRQEEMNETVDTTFIRPSVTAHDGGCDRLPLETSNFQRGLKTSRDNRAKPIQVVGVFVNSPLEEIVETVRTVGLDVVQLHGDEEESFIRTLQEAIHKPVWKAVALRCADDAKRWEESHADMLVFDAYDRSMRGGTGQTCNWSWLAQYPRPYMLAGGLKVDNVVRALRSLHPFGIDVSSGIEVDGHKDGKIMRDMMRMILSCRE